MYCVFSILCACVGYLFRTCVWGVGDGSAFEASCCRVRGSFAEDAVGAEVFLRTWDATERRCTQQDFSHVPFGHQELAIQFFKNVGLIGTKVQCNICVRDMTWSADPERSDGFRWRCRKSVASVMCRGTASISHGSWFHLSNLTLGNYSYYVRHPAPGLCPPNRKRT